MHEDNGAGAQAAIMGGLQALAGGIGIKHLDYLSVCAQPFGYFDDLLVQHLGQFDIEREEFRSCLVSDAKRIAEAFRGDKDEGFSLALQEGIGGDRRTHFHRIDLRGRNIVGFIEAQEVADALQRRILILLRIFAQQLVGDNGAIRRAGDKIGKGAAAIDPELPVAGCHIIRGFCHSLSRLMVLSRRGTFLFHIIRHGQS